MLTAAAARTQHQQTTMTTKVYSQRSSSTPAAETGDSDVTGKDFVLHLHLHTHSHGQKY